jgi:hypothetical protein
VEQPRVGCVLCGATWGDYWEEIEGKRLFFCCDVCATQYKTILNETKKRTGWDSVDRLEMQGDYRGRVCRVTRGSASYRFMISFFDDGRVRTFFELDVRPKAGHPPNTSVGSG